MAREGQLAAALVHAKDRDVVRTLVAAVEEAVGRVKGEAAGIVPMRPLLGHKGERAVRTDGKDADAVVQTVAGINKLSVGGDSDLGAEITACITRRQAGDRLTGGEAAGLRIEVKQHDRRAFLLDRVEPAPIRMEGEVTWTVAGRQRNKRCFGGCECAFVRVELPHEDLIEPQDQRG